MVRLKSNRVKWSVDSIGGKLRKARLDKGISLEEAHRVTKIHPRVLEALEEDKLENILGRTYVKAFLKDYAQYLGLDVKKIIHDYSAGLAPQIDTKSSLEPKPFVLKKEERNYTHAIIITLTVIVWILILGFVTMHFIRSYRAFVENKKIAASRRAESKPAEEKIAKKVEEKTPEQGLISIPKARIISLAITARDKSWLKITQDGKVAFHAILPENSKETWQANKEIMITEIGKPEALSFNVNGKDIDFSGRRLGKGILITPEGINLEPKKD